MIKSTTTTNVLLLLLVACSCCLLCMSEPVEPSHYHGSSGGGSEHGYYYDEKSSNEYYKTDYLNMRQEAAGGVVVDHAAAADDQSSNGVYVYHSGSNENYHHGAAEESNGDPSSSAYASHDEAQSYSNGGVQFYLNEVPFNVDHQHGQHESGVFRSNKSNSSSSSGSISSSRGFHLSDLRHYEVFLPKFKKIFVYIIFAVILFTCIFGNILVILSVFTYKPLKSVQNIFIVSLAVADTMVAVFVMPFHVIYQITDGRWVFGTLTCHFFLTLDILLCTSSILHLCCIALDRYWAIKDSIKYAQKRTMKRVLTMILIAWLSSALISLPVIIWNTKTVGSVTSTPTAAAATTVVPPTSHLTETETTTDSSNIMASTSTISTSSDTIVVDVVCDIPFDKLYRFYSSSGTFWVPLIIMTFVYVRIFLETKRRLRERARTAKKLANSMAKSSIIPSNNNTIINDLPSSSAYTLKSNLSRLNNGGSVSQNKSFCPCVSSNKSNKKSSSSTIRNLVVYQESPPEDSDGDRDGKMSQILELTTTDGYTCYSPEEETTTQAGHSFYSSAAAAASSVSKSVISPDQPSHMSMRSNETDQFLSRDDIEEPKSDEIGSPASRCHRPHGSSIKKVSIGINTMSRKIPKIRINDESTTITTGAAGAAGALAANRPSNMSKTSRTSSSVMGSAVGGVGSELTVSNFSPVTSPVDSSGGLINQNNTKKPAAAAIAWRDNNQTGLALKQRQKISLTRERKAARTLGIIMGAFIACWMPFFAVYLLQAFNYLVDWPGLFEFLTWLSYVNSALNPVIYTVFNNDYRKSFERILFKCVLCKRRGGGGGGYNRR